MMMMMLGVWWQVTDDGTTEVTSCGSRTSEQGSSSQHQRLQHQQQASDADHHPALIAGEMSQHERASSWVDNLPTDSNDTTAPAVSTATRNHGQSAGNTNVDVRSTMSRLQDGVHNTNHSSHSISYDEAKYVNCRCFTKHCFG